MALIMRTSQFAKPVIYEWEQPEFNPQNDAFIKNFDEKGNFNPPPKPEEIIKEYFSSSLKVVSDFIGIKK
jgi:hypothetical protein